MELAVQVLTLLFLFSCALSQPTLTVEGDCSEAIFTCSTTNLPDITLRWYLDEDVLALYRLSPQDRYPLTVEPLNTTSSVLVGSVKIEVLRASRNEDGGSTASFLSTMAVQNVSALEDAGVFSISCGSTLSLSSENITSIYEEGQTQFTSAIVSLAVIGLIAYLMALPLIIYSTVKLPMFLKDVLDDRICCIGYFGTLFLLLLLSAALWMAGFILIGSQTGDCNPERQFVGRALFISAFIFSVITLIAGLPIPAYFLFIYWFENYVPMQ